MKNKIKETFYDIIFCGGGCILYSVAISVFAEDNGITQGGITGVAMLVNFLFPLIPTGVASFIFNVPLFILAFFRIGGKFIAKSFLVTTFLSFSIDALSFLPSYTGDRMLSSIFCGVLSGISMAMILMRDLTSGGTDIVAKLIRLKKPHFSMGRLILITDFIVIALAGAVYRNAESAMYSLVLIFVSSYVLDKILFGLTDSRTLLIITSSWQKISLGIMSEIGRGVSILNVEGAYTGKERKLLMCAVRRNEVSKIAKMIPEFDKNAFTIVLPSSEIMGEGFRKQG
ncbi:MAG: YitT family protein [Clostridia bacterium]|nr:YitT family protein [Clostridia bacterium]